MIHRHQPRTENRSDGHSEAITGHPGADGQLRPALHRLTDAIALLCDPHLEVVAGRHRHTPSWYQQLRDSLAGGQSEGGGGARLVPIWADALDLLIEIDTAVACWQPAGTSTPDRLRAIEHHWTTTGRPQDCRQIDQISGIVTSWVTGQGGIRRLLTEERRWTLPNPCPACGTAIAYRKDSGGATVRIPALQISPTGCACAACRTVWPPDKFEWLARVLGYEMRYNTTGS